MPVKKTPEQTENVRNMTIDELEKYEKAVNALNPGLSSLPSLWSMDDMKEAAAQVKGETYLSRMSYKFNDAPLMFSDRPLLRLCMKAENNIKQDIRDVKNGETTQGPSSALRKLKAIPDVWGFLWALRLSVGTTTKYYMQDEAVWAFLKLKYNGSAQPLYSKDFARLFHTIWFYRLELFDRSLYWATDLEAKIHCFTKNTLEKSARRSGLT